MRRPVWSVNSYKGTELPSINVGDHNESWIDENMSYVKSDKARYLGSNLTSIQRRSVQDAKLWLRRAMTNLWKMSSAALLCWLPSAGGGFGSPMTSNNSESTSDWQHGHTHTYPCISISILLYGRDSPSWRVVKTSAKNAGSSIGNLLFSLSIWENAASAENWIQAEESDFAETARAAGMMKEKVMRKQRVRETEREQLAQVDFLLSCQACLLSCLPGPCVPLYIKRGRHSLNSHSGSLSTAEREAPPQQTKWWERENK